MSEAGAGDGLAQALARGGRGFLHDHLPGLVNALEWIAAAIEVVAIAVMTLGALRFVAAFMAAELSRAADHRLHALDGGRLELGRYILSGLELLIVADIIHTALSFAWGDLLFLAVLVLVRSAISYFLTREIREIGESMAR